MTTGSWVIRSSDCGYVSILTEGGGIGFGDAPNALIFPTKTAAQHAMRGYAKARGEQIVYERSLLAEEEYEKRLNRFGSDPHTPAKSGEES